MILPRTLTGQRGNTSAASIWTNSRDHLLSFLRCPCHQHLQISKCQARIPTNLEGLPPQACPNRRSSPLVYKRSWTRPIGKRTFTMSYTTERKFMRLGRLQREIQLHISLFFRQETCANVILLEPRLQRKVTFDTLPMQLVYVQHCCLHNVT
jgi:hypothetical protein